MLLPAGVVPAAASPAESGLALVSNQDASGSCSVSPTAAYDNHVLIAQPLTGALVSDLGRPASINGKLDEAKPIENNTKVLALWGDDGTNLGGVGIYDRSTSAWTTAFPLPSDFGSGDGIAHSVAELPDGNVVVAQTGTIAGSGWGYLVVFDRSGNKKQQIALQGVHGVDWDTPRTALFAVGDEYVKQYSYDATAQTLGERASWALPVGPTGAKGGHDLRRRRTSNDYFVTTNDQAYVFTPETGTFTAYTKPGTSTTLGSGVKSMDERFDGIVNYDYGNNSFFFADRGPVTAQFCMKGYKVRWLYNSGDPLYNENAPSPPPAPSPSGPATAEPFLWEKNIITGSGSPTLQSHEIWAGGAAGDSRDSAAQKILDAYNANPSQVPYVEFYHWGDSGSPNMANVTSATPAQWQSWRDYASSMATAIGTRSATIVIEPEWDANPSAPCNGTYVQTLKDVIGIFRAKAPKARLLNSVGLWKSDSDYNCFKNAGLPALFDGNGFSLHLLSNAPDCTLRDPSSPWYSTEPHYIGGYTLADARSIVQNLGANSGKVTRVRNLFGGDAYITDAMITRCPAGWGDSGQAQIIGDLSSQLTTLYSNSGLRGVAFRDGGPSPSEAYTGAQNERYTDYQNNAGAMTQINSGTTAMQSYLGGISGQPTDPPAFTTTVTGPANVAPGGSATFTLTVTNTKGSLSNGNVDLEIFDPSATRVNQPTWSGQSFANGETRTYSYTWTAPSTGGTYQLKSGVFDSAWTSPPISWNETAATIAVGSADPAFTSSVSASPASIAPAGTTTLTATVTSTGGALSNGVVELTVHNAAGSTVDQQSFSGQSIGAGATATYQMTWTAPQSAGTYTVAVAVYGAGFTPQYHSNGNAGTVIVATSRYTSSATVSSASVVPGGTSTITATVTNTDGTPLSGGIVDVEVYDAGGNRVSQVYWTAQTIAVGASASYSTTWTGPATSGSYAVEIGVFGPNWAPTLHWNSAAASITVLTASFDIDATAAPDKVQAGGPTTITVDATDKGGAIGNAIVDAEVYNSAGTRVAQQFWSGQSLEYGVTHTYAWSYTAPTTNGTYTVKLGVFNSTWGTTYKWNNGADTITVTDPTFTSGADVSAASVSSGATVTLTGNFTATGGSLTNGITDIEVYDPTGTRVAQYFQSGQAVATGHVITYSHDWVAASVPGTYTVRLGVFNSDWSKTWHWNNSAATISVGSSTFQPSFRVGSGANTWWFEVYTSNDVTSVDVIADDGRIYMSLPKTSWGAYAAQPPSEVLSGQLVRFIARRSSDGASAASTNFAWLTATPATEAGWASTITVGSGASTTWMEATATGSPTSVEVKVGKGAWTALTYSAASGKWGATMTTAAGAKVVFRATRADGAKAYSTFYNWLQ